MSDERYATIVADPPWQQMGGPLRHGDGWRWRTGGGPSKPLPYPTMPLDEIKALPVADLALDDAHLYVWTTNAYVEHVYGVARAWGFRPSTLITWKKRAMGGGLGGAWRITSEHVLYARRGKPETTGRIVGTCFDWKRPYDKRGKPQHSAKPPAFLDLVEQVSPGPYLEMFARGQRLGWDSWGDEALAHAQIGGPP